MTVQQHQPTYVMSNASFRLRHLLTEDKLSQVDLAQLVDRSEGTVSSYLNADGDISDKFLRLVEDKLGWSARWIRTGRGPKRVGANSMTVAEEPVADYTGPTDFNVSAQVSREKPNMWMVPIKAQAGFVRGFEGRTFKNQIQQVAWPLVNGECFCFEVEGLSMFPVYLPNTWLVCTILPEWDWLKRGRNYVFQTFDGLYIKQFDRIESKHLYLNSINTETGPIAPIPIGELRMVYVIEGKYMKE